MDESSKLEQRIKHTSNIIDEMFKTRKHVSFMDSNSFRITAIIPKGLSNDYTNDRMLTHCYQQKKSNQFIDFIERVDSSYDLNIKRIFLV
ncbi:MAG: hypothetical protein WAK17_03535, partial [Candidatus Nitrosopolaris sp.]